MSIDLFQRRDAIFTPKTLVQDTPTFGQTVSANLGYQYAPITDFLTRRFTVDQAVDNTFNPMDHIEGYEQFPELILSPNKEDFDMRVAAIDANIRRRSIMYKSSMLANFGAGLFDPINIVALPFGGPSVSIGRSMLRTGASVGALQAGQETLRQPFDPLASPFEPIMNITSAMAGGAIIGGLVKIPAARRASAFIKTKEALGEFNLGFNPIINRFRPDPTTGRPLSQLDQISIDAQLKGLPNSIDGQKKLQAALQNSLDELPDVPKNATERQKLINGIETSRKKIAEHEEQLRLFENESTIRKRHDDVMGKGMYNIASNAWVDSWFYKFVTTPMKRQLQNKQITDNAKRTLLEIAGDSGIVLNLHKHGLAMGPSTYQMSQTRHGEWVMVHDALRQSYQKEYKLGNEVFPDLSVRSRAQKTQRYFSGKKIKTYEEWIEEVNIKRIKGEKPKTEAESEAMALIDNFYETWSKRLEQTGLLGSTRSLERRIEYKNNQITRVSKELDDLLKNKGGQLKIEYKQQRLKQLQDQLDELEVELVYIKDTKFLPANEEVFNPRYWNVQKILANRDQFARILFNWYQNNLDIVQYNPRTKTYETKTLSPDPDAINARVKDTIDTITGKKDAGDESLIYYGRGKSKHLRHRELDIPNALVVDFIQTNPVAVMRNYTNRTAPVYEFHNKFNRNIDEVMDDIEEELFDAGLSMAERNAYRKDTRHLYDRVAGTVLRNPDSWDQNIATMLKNAAQLNYLGSAGFSTLPDMAKILMEHEMGTVFKALFGVMSDSRVRLSSKEGRQAGEILEILQGDAHMRHTEYLQNNVFNTGFVSGVVSKFHIANMLAPATNIFKKFDAIARGHTIVDYSMKVVNNTATDMEVTYLARYNIDAKKALKIKKLVDNGTIQKTESDLYLPNTSKWLENGADEDILNTFRSSMNSGIMNTILMGTPADKPIAVDGVFYIPMHIAKNFGMTEDLKFRGYARIENGLLGLPFQFMSYSFAAANKVTAALAQGQVRNRLAVILSSMGLGYMAMELKYKDWQMEKMTFADKIARSFDASGIAALYSDLFYTAMNTSMALGGPDIGMGIVNPKFPQEQNYVDAVTAIAGAGPSWGVDTGRAVKEFVTGNYGEGFADFMKQMPYMRLWFLKDEINGLGRAIEGRY